MDNKRSETATTNSHSLLAQKAIQNQLINESQPLAGFINIDGVKQTVQTLKQAFPEHFEHYFAVKANSMSTVLALLKTLGIRAETASPGELQQALNAGFTGKDIVFDEPAKTPSIIKKILNLGACLHIDNFDEMERVRVLLPPNHQGEIGYRINPQVGSGDIKAMSTAGQHSKFGVALKDSGNRTRIIQDYLATPWLNTIHCHIGSQGCSFALIAEGLKCIVELAQEINQKAGEQRITSLDIGGGLAVNFKNDEITPSFQDYADFLQEHIPALFTGEFRVKTEFGRAIMAKNGVIISRIEYTKNSGGRDIVITHAGAQIAARTVFMPDAWSLRLSAFDHQGQVKNTPLVEQDIVGPCCFAGDVIAHQRTLPKLTNNDYVMIHDTGAYYFANPFFYNSLPVIAVYGYQINGQQPTFNLYRQQQTLEQMAALIG